MTNVFKIRHGKETHVYRSDSPSDKKALLAQFRQVADDLAAKKRKEREGEHERRKSMWQGGDVCHLPSLTSHPYVQSRHLLLYPQCQCRSGCQI